MYIDKQEIILFFKLLQDSICQQLEVVDGGGKFQEDVWECFGGGGGCICIFQGQCIVKGGVNFFVVYGEMLEWVIYVLGVEFGCFLAIGVSIVQYLVSLMVFIIYMNVCYFEMENGLYWFGGGIDLMLYYINKKDVWYFYEQLKVVCDWYYFEFYFWFKKWVDDYFYLKYCKEMWGVGGIFFDWLNEESEGLLKEAIFFFVKEVGEIFVFVYSELIIWNQDKFYGEWELSWQVLCWGCYVEFNLVWDKGIKFGFDIDGCIEFIFMSLLLVVYWVYSY